MLAHELTPDLHLRQPHFNITSLCCVSTPAVSSSSSAHVLLSQRLVHQHIPTMTTVSRLDPHSAKSRGIVDSSTTQPLGADRVPAKPSTMPSDLQLPNELLYHIISLRLSDDLCEVANSQTVFKKPYYDSAVKIAKASPLLFSLVYTKVARDQDDAEKRYGAAVKLRLVKAEGCKLCQALKYGRLSLAHGQVSCPWCSEYRDHVQHADEMKDALRLTVQRLQNERRKANKKAGKKGMMIWMATI